MKLKLIKRQKETSDTETFFFEPAETLTWKAGQFFHYVLHHEPTDDRGSDRWFTNSAAPSENVVRISTRINKERSSTFKKALAELKIGEEIEISDVDGDFLLGGEDQEYVFIAGGIGVTPFRSILKQAEHEGKKVKVDLLYANRNEEVPFKEELEDLAKSNSNLKIHYVFSPERIDEAKIKELVPDLKKPFFYVSGPEPMVEALGNTLKEIGVPSEHIRQDWFPGYPEE